MSALVAVAADLLVAILLVATIATSVRLSRHMARMKADEGAMRRTIADLVAATDTAQRAIGDLRSAVADSERSLADRLGAAARHTGKLAEQIAAADALSETLRAIRLESPKPSPPLPAVPSPAATGPALVVEGDPRPSLRDAVRAARDIATRSAMRLEGRAA